MPPKLSLDNGARSKRPARRVPLTHCAVNTRSNPTRFTNFWKNRCQGLLTLEHHRLIAEWPFRHFLDMPDMKLQRGFLLEFLRLWDTSTSSFDVKGNMLRPNGQDISAILSLRAKGKPVDVTQRRGDRIKSRIAKRFFNSTTVSNNELEQMLYDELVLRNRVATPAEWMALFTMYFFTTTLFAQSNNNVPMQFWEYVDEPAQLWDYQWGVAAYDFLTRQLPEVGFKAFNDQPTNPTMVGCTFALLCWFYECSSPAALRISEDKSPRYNNWNFSTDCTKATFLSHLRAIDTSDSNNGRLTLRCDEAWVIQTSLDEVVAGYELMNPYISSSAYRASQSDPPKLPTPIKTFSDQKRKKPATSTSPNVRNMRNASMKKTPPNFKKTGSQGPSLRGENPENKTDDDFLQKSIRSPLAMKPRQLTFKETILEIPSTAATPPGNQVIDTSPPTDSPIDALDDIQLTQLPRDFIDSDISPDGYISTPWSDRKPPLPPKKAYSEPAKMATHRTMTNIPFISRDLLLEDLSNPHVQHSILEKGKSLVQATSDLTLQSPPIYDKTPSFESPGNRGGLLDIIATPQTGLFRANQNRSIIPTGQSPAVRRLRHSLVHNGSAVYSQGSGEFEVTRQYAVSPFSQDEILQRDVDYRYEDTIKYNWKGYGVSYPSKGFLPPYMDRVIFAWQTGLILADKEYIFNHGNYVINHADAKSVLYGHPISTRVIDTLLHIMHMFNQSLGAKWNFVNCAHTGTVPHLSSKTLQQPEYTQYKADHMKDSRWIVLPVLSMDHWFLVVFDFYDREIKVYNSLPDNERFRFTVRQLTNAWKPYLRGAMQSEDVMKWQPSNKWSPTLNKNRDDAGLYIVKVVDCLVGRRAINFTSDTIRSDRGRVVYNLLASSYFPGSFPENEKM